MNILDLVSVADVKQLLGLSSTDSEHNEQIEGAIVKLAPLFLEDFFTLEEIRNFTANQKERVRVGLSYLMAGEALYPISTNMSLLDMSSVRVGPIAVSGSSSSGPSSYLSKRARELRREGMQILETLKVAMRGTIVWGVV